MSPAVLVIAGRDPTGGAGVDADREAARAQGCEIAEVVTAETDQDGRRVFGVRPRPAETWLLEARAALPRVAAVKSGLLPGAEHVRALARLATDLPLVVDPVLAASGGEVFLDDEGVAALLEELLPCGPILTPNALEAARLVDVDPGRMAAAEAREAAARVLLEHGAAAVVLKGGHLEEDPVRDLVLTRSGPAVWHAHPRVPGAGLHGSGCRHATALAAGLASGLDVAGAAAAAGEYLARLLRR